MKKFVIVLFTLVGLILSPKIVLADDGCNEFCAWNTSREFHQGTFTGGAQLNNYGRPSITLDKGQQNGVWESPIVTLKNQANVINPSWQTDTPLGTHISVQLSVRNNGQWSNWYKMGEWAFNNTSTFQRTSINNQSDQFGTIYTDTYINTTAGKVDAYRLKVELFAYNNYHPKVFQLAAQVSNPQAFSSVSSTTMHNTIDLPVPQFSQYQHDGEYTQFGGGGEAWCSPTSVAMILKYWHTGPTEDAIESLPADPVFDAHGRVDGEVDYAAIHIYDLAYDGTGNWPFNTAYAASYGLNTSVRVFSSLRDVEQLIKQGVPVVISLNWNNEDNHTDNDLPGASIPKTDGHLMVIRGFTQNGDVITNDPATPSGDAEVHHIYPRLPLERQWINASGGTVYVISPLF